MNKAKFFFSFLLVASVTAQAAEITKVIVRQQWPWSDGIKVEYVIKGVTSPVDIGVQVFKDGVEVPVPRGAAMGDVYGIEQSGVGTITIDPVQVLGSGRVESDDLEVKLSVSSSKGDPNEVLYKIFDLTSKPYVCTDVTRRELLLGKYGSVVTDYREFGSGFKTDVDDLLIWTGVTNDIAYKTTKLVMRKINAKGKVWQSGDEPSIEYQQVGAVPRHWIKLTYDYYIAVFETTIAQWKRIYDGSLPTDVEGNKCATAGGEGSSDPEEYPTACYPANRVQRWCVYGHPQSSFQDSYNCVVIPDKPIWGMTTYLRDVGKLTVCENLWTDTGYEFNYPTGAEWEFACRGGNSGPIYSGEAQTKDNVGKIAWNTYNSGAMMHVVGMKAPNPYGLYDMLGNIMEQVQYDSTDANLIAGPHEGSGDTEDDPAIDPICGSTGRTANNSNHFVVGAGYYNDSTYGSWKDQRPTCRCGWYAYHYQTSVYAGFRLVMPATANGRWADHPAK